MKKLMKTLKRVFGRGRLSVIGSEINRSDEYIVIHMRGVSYGLQSR